MNIFIFDDRCSGFSSIDKIPSSSNTHQVPIQIEGRPISESQLGQSTLTSSSSSTSASSSSNINENLGYKFNVFPIPLGSPSLDRFVTQSQHSAQEQLQSSSGQDGHKSTSAIDYGKVDPLVPLAPLVPPPSGGGQYMHSAWEKTSSWSSHSTVSRIFPTY